MKRFAKIVFGSLALLMGTAILVWCAYSFFVPNQYFHWRLIDIPERVVNGFQARKDAVLFSETLRCRHGFETSVP